MAKKDRTKASDTTKKIFKVLKPKLNSLGLDGIVTLESSYGVFKVFYNGNFKESFTVRETLLKNEKALIEELVQKSYNFVSIFHRATKLTEKSKIFKLSRKNGFFEINCYDISARFNSTGFASKDEETKLEKMEQNAESIIANNEKAKEAFGNFDDVFEIATGLERFHVEFYKELPHGSDTVSGNIADIDSSAIQVKRMLQA